MSGNSNWREIAEQASKEMDGDKLSHLIGELVRAIDEEHNERTQNIARKRPQPED
jgi:hypothetical protein